MKYIFLTLLVGVSFLLTSAQENFSINDPNAERRNTGNFHAIHAEDGIDIYLLQGNEEAIAVSASKTEYRDRIISKVENGVLKLYFRKDSEKFWVNRKLKAYISFRELDAIHASGGSDIFIKGTISSKKLDVHLTGGSDIVGSVTCEMFSIVQSGGSDANLSGRAASVKISATGGSDCDGYDLVSETATIHASGGSDVNITVNRNLTAEVTGGSDLQYRGNAAVKKSSSGGSSVTKRG